MLKPHNLKINFLATFVFFCFFVFLFFFFFASLLPKASQRLHENIQTCVRVCVCVFSDMIALLSCVNQMCRSNVDQYKHGGLLLFESQRRHGNYTGFSCQSRFLRSINKTNTDSIFKIDTDLVGTAVLSSSFQNFFNVKLPK